MIKKVLYCISSLYLINESGWQSTTDSMTFVAFFIKVAILEFEILMGQYLNLGQCYFNDEFMKWFDEDF